MINRRRITVNLPTLLQTPFASTPVCKYYLVQKSGSHYMVEEDTL